MRSSAAARALLLAAFLAAGSGKAAGVSTAPLAAPQVSGRDLAAELGCGACHAGVPGAERIRARAPALASAAAPLAADFVFTYLADPVRRRDDIGAARMPDFRLDEAERVALALFLAPRAPGGGGDLAAARGRHPEATAEAGRRIFDALGCAGCHADVPGGTPIAGPSAAPVATPVTAPDLSREGARVRADWLEDFLARPTAVRGDGHPTLGAARMPDFRLTAEETTALAAYLGGLGTRFATLDTTALTPFTAERTGRLLEDRLACLGCHRVAGRGGRIGPSLEGVASRLQPSFVLETIIDPQRAAPGSPMPHQAMPPREAARLARLILAADGTWSAPERRPLTTPDHPALSALSALSARGSAAPTAVAGAALYARHCVACHGPEGRGDGWNAPDLPVPPAAHADPARMGARVDDALYDGIAAGAWVLDGSPRMPAFGDLLTPAEIRTLVGYIRTLCSCSAPAWSRDGRQGAQGIGR